MSARFEPRWTSGGAWSAAAKGKVQRSEPHSGIPIQILHLAWEEYAAQGNGSQSLFEIQKRGGFSEAEVVMLLADALERSRAGSPSGETQ